MKRWLNASITAFWLRSADEIDAYLCLLHRLVQFSDILLDAASCSPQPGQRLQWIAAAQPESAARSQKGVSHCLSADP